MDDLTFYQVNLRKMYAATAELNNHLNRKSSFVVLIQEPVVRSGKIMGLNRKRGNVVHASLNGRPRAVIYISKNLNIHPLYNLSSLDQAVLMLSISRNGKERKIIVCSSYFPYDSVSDPPTSEFNDLSDYCKINNLPLLSGIDTNAHHSAWGSTNINPFNNLIIVNQQVYGVIITKN